MHKLRSSLAVSLFLLLPPTVSLAQRQGGIWGSKWDNVPWRAVRYSPILQYRWVEPDPQLGGGGACGFQLRTTDGSRVKVDLNIFFRDSTAEWLHWIDVNVSGHTNTDGSGSEWSQDGETNGSILRGVESGDGCLSVTSVEINELAPDGRP